MAKHDNTDRTCYHAALETGGEIDLILNCRVARAVQYHP